MRKWLPWLLFAGLVAVFCGMLYEFRYFLIDDTLITYRYVEEFVHGNGLVWNINEKVEGYSTFLWTMILAGPAALGFNLVIAAKAIAVAFGLLTLLLTFLMGRRLFGQDSLWALVPVALMVVSGTMVAWSIDGMEAPLVFFLVTAATLRLWAEWEKPGRLPLSAGLYVLVALARPEGAAFAVAVAAFWAVTLWRAKAGRREWLRLGVWGAICVALFLPYEGWRLWYYGWPFPNSVYAKQQGLNPRPILRGLYSIFVYAAKDGAMGELLLFPLAIRWAVLRRDRRVGVILSQIGIYLVFIVLSGSDWMPYSRFFAHILPLIAVTATVGLRDLYLALLNLPQSAAAKQTANLVVAWILAGSLGFLFFGAMEQRLFEQIGAPPLASTTPYVTQYISNHVKPGDTIAVDLAGVDSYNVPLTVNCLDMIGLNDPHLGHLPVKYLGGLFTTRLVFGKWDGAYVLNSRPKFIEMTPIRFVGYQEMVQSPEFLALYQPVPDPRITTLWELKGAQ